jgi:hypothetical protein
MDNAKCVMAASAYDDSSGDRQTADYSSKAKSQKLKARGTLTEDATDQRNSERVHYWHIVDVTLHLRDAVLLDTGPRRDIGRRQVGS